MLLHLFGLLNLEQQPGPSRNNEEPTYTPNPKLNITGNVIKTQKRRTWTPPIIINRRVANYKTFADRIKESLGYDQFLIKFNRNNVKVFVKNILDHDKLVKELKEANSDFYTYIKPEESFWKGILK